MKYRFQQNGEGNWNSVETDDDIISFIYQWHYNQVNYSQPGKYKFYIEVKYEDDTSKTFEFTGEIKLAILNGRPFVRHMINHSLVLPSDNESTEFEAA